MADLPLDLGAALRERLARSLDVEGKIPRALDALGPIRERAVVLLDAHDDDRRAVELRDLGGAVTTVAGHEVADWVVPPASADTVVGLWSVLRGAEPADLAAVEAMLRPGGRLLVVQDYGRDDIPRATGDARDATAWSRRDGPYLTAGFKVRVIHCFLTFDTIEQTRDFVIDAFGAGGEAVGAALQRPRLSYNIAVYHRTFGDLEP